MENDRTQPAGSPDADGFAALGICESLLLALSDLKVISEQDARDILSDVVSTHTEAALASHAPERHEAVVAIIQRMLAVKDSLPH